MADEISWSLEVLNSLKVAVMNQCEKKQFKK